MNQFRIILAAGAAMTALAIAVPTAAHPEGATTRQEVREIKIIKADGDKDVQVEKVINGGPGKEEFVADCGKGRKFESSSTTGTDEKHKSVSKMVICSDAGKSDAEWKKTLSDALARVEKDEHMPAAGKAQILADLRSEIAKLGK